MHELNGFTIDFDKEHINTQTQRKHTDGMFDMLYSSVGSNVDNGIESTNGSGSGPSGPF